MANFQEVGTVDCSILKLNKVTREGVNYLAQCFNTAGDTPSGPQALLPSRLESTLKTSDSVKNIFDKNMFLHQSISGRLQLMTHQCCLLNMQAIPLGLVAFTPS